MICSFRVIKINWIRSDEQGKVAYLSNWQFFVDKGRIPFIFQFQSGILRILIQFHLQNTQHFLVITLKTLLSLFHITSFGLTPWVSFFGFNVNFNLIFNTNFQGEFREIHSKNCKKIKNPNWTEAFNQLILRASVSSWTQLSSERHREKVSVDSVLSARPVNFKSKQI